MTPLRDYQVRAIEQVRAEVQRKHRSVLLVLPTGAGKTRVGVEIALQHIARGGRVLWLAHRIELVEQAAKRLRLEGIERVGVIAAGVAPDPEAPVQVASVQTLVARGERPDVTLVVCDEAHHFAAAEWRELADHYRGAWRIGLTATPERSDGKALGDLFDALVAPVSVSELMAAGHLVPCEVIAPAKRLKREIAGDPVERYLERARGRRAIFFTTTVAEAETLAARLSAEGVPAASVSAETPDDERAAALERFERGELLALTNVYVLTEGTDLPAAEVCVLARGFGHASTYLQCVGRVLRPAPGKERALVIDLTGTSRKHGVPEDEREYSLEGKAIRLKKRREAQEAKAAAAAMQVVDAELLLVRRIKSTAAKWMRGMRGEKRTALEGWIRDAMAAGRKPGSAVHRFRATYGHLPWEPAPAMSMESVG